MDINNIHRDLTATVEAPVKPMPLAHILKNQNNASYLISTPRTVSYVYQTCAKFLATYAKQENAKPQAERVSRDEKGGTVKIWVRSYGNNTYMIETDETNVVEGI